MNYSLLLLFLICCSLTPVVFADYRGEDYLDIDNGDGTHTLKTNLPYYVLNNGVYVPYIQNGLMITSSIGTVILNTDGTYSWNGKFDDTILAKYSDVTDQINWTYPNSLNNDSPDVSFSNDSFISSKSASGIGQLDYKYVLIDGKWKTQLEAKNLSSLTTKVFGFDQIIDLHSDTIKFGGVIRNLDNFNGTTFDKEFLDSNEGKVLDLLNGVNFDFDLGYENLYSITVYDTGINSSRLVFDYRTTDVLLPGETLVIDPTFTDTNVTFYRILMAAQTGTSCSTTGSHIASATRTAFLDDSDISGNCAVSAYTFDISPLDETWIVTAINLNVTASQASNMGGISGEFVQIDNPLSGAGWTDTAANTKTQFDAIQAETTIYNSTTALQATGNFLIPLDSDAITDFNTNLHGMIDYFDVGYRLDSVTRISAGPIQSTFSELILEVTYEIPQPTTTTIDLNTDTVGDLVTINGTVTLDDAYPLPVILDSLQLLKNGTNFNLNGTNSTFTALNQIVNFGPFYDQITSSDYINYTMVATLDNATGSQVTNSSSLIIPWEYDPDYFTALDPTQGLVNYTFVGDTFIQVNRDKSAAAFNIECRYFTQAQAFLNELTSGVWDNHTNVYYYIGDTSGYYYVQCFNDGELFVAAISQNFTNSLVPGLVIFDQLGGFFGAPSITLVILSILSLGTGRNYPIILLIAASVTGILLALELLTLDPGLVVALIVMAGIGLFGIRKFY